MSSYVSPLMTSLYANDQLISPSSRFLHFKENFMGGSTITDGTGSVLLETRPHAGGGETVEFSDGETAHLTENIYGSSTLDFTGMENDIVGTASIFGTESYSQGGTFIGSTSPNSFGEGVVFTNSTSDTVVTASPDFLGGTQIAFTSPIIDVSSNAAAFDIQNSFSEIETLASGTSAADLGSATDAIDGFDFLGLF
ncbi:hypothetical protein [Planomicrobium sp. Y74]|uniref:hypothetical protein n=1 Tax=Planomicrobium sp. Y74 TaxID=2478977 RepID=UPI0011C46A94|nr:hypothetical protein [Planomicrobium sp. Y74]